MKARRRDDEPVVIDLTQEPSESGRNPCTRQRTKREAEEAEAKSAGIRQHGGSSKEDDEQDNDDDDEDVVVVKTVTSRQTRLRRGKGSSSSSSDQKRSKADEHVLGAEEDLAITGTAGQDVLRDLPHQRPDCAEHKFHEGGRCRPNAKHCSQCYCYVCDVKASECTAWGSGINSHDHCNACKADDGWRRLRGQAQQGGTGRDGHGGKAEGRPAAAAPCAAPGPRQRLSSVGRFGAAAITTPLRNCVGY